MKVLFRGGLAVALLLSCAVGFFAVVLSGDSHTFSLRAGLACLVIAAVVVPLGFKLNGEAHGRARPRSLLSAPHELWYMPVQFWGIVVGLAGIAMLVQYWV